MLFHKKWLWRLYHSRNYYKLMVTFNYSIIGSIKKRLPISSDYQGMTISYSYFLISSDMRYVWRYYNHEMLSGHEQSRREDIRIMCCQEDGAQVLNYSDEEWEITVDESFSLLMRFVIVYMRGMMKEPLNVVIRMIVLNVLRWMVIMIWWMYLLICVVVECIEIEMKIWWFWYWYDIW